MLKGEIVYLEKIQAKEEQYSRIIYIEFDKYINIIFDEELEIPMTDLCKNFGI